MIASKAHPDGIIKEVKARKRLPWENKHQFQSYPLGEKVIKGRRNTHARIAQMGWKSDLSGINVIDFGCSLGGFCVEAKKRNASRTVGIDNHKATICCAKKIAKFNNCDIEYYRCRIENTNKILDIVDGTHFDYVICLAILGWVDCKYIHNILDNISFGEMFLEVHRKKLKTKKGKRSIYSFLNRYKKHSVCNLGRAVDDENRQVWKITI